MPVWGREVVSPSCWLDKVTDMLVLVLVPVLHTYRWFRGVNIVRLLMWLQVAGIELCCCCCVGRFGLCEELASSGDLCGLVVGVGW
jgi:hypothetical protein